MNKELYHLLKKICDLDGLDSSQGAFIRFNGYKRNLPSGGVSSGFSIVTAFESKSYTLANVGSESNILDVAKELLRRLERYPALCFEQVNSQCERWNHRERDILYCDNPYCPSSNLVKARRKIN